MTFDLDLPSDMGVVSIPAPIPHRPKRVTVAEIKCVVADYYKIPLIEMTSARRSRGVARPRQMAMYLARNLTPKSLPDIGARFGGRDHTTVIHAIRTIERLREVDAEIDRDIEALTEELAG